MTVFAGGRVLTPDGVVEPGWVAVTNGLITGCGEGPPPDVGPSVVDLAGRWLVPGFVDLHVHGGGGHTVTAGDPADAAAAMAFHRRHGTTTSLLSLVTGPVDALEAAIGRLAGLVEADRSPDGSPGAIAGIHLEGPFLSRLACGAHDPDRLRAPDLDVVARLVDAGRGTVRMVTLAPELDGALAAIEHLVGRAVIAAVGHTRADHEQAIAAFDAGATVATHLFNCMGSLHHRDPGTIGAALADDRVTTELIVDGEHLHPDTVRLAVRAKTPRRAALVTDAIALAGSTDGELALGSKRIEVRGGVARLATADGSPGPLAGSTLTMDAAFRNVVALGATVAEASEMASAAPARVLGLDTTRGTIEPGRRADLVVLDDALAVAAVYLRGRLVD